MHRFVSGTIKIPLFTLNSGENVTADMADGGDAISR
jgi:hypothetical protein